MHEAGAAGAPCLKVPSASSGAGTPFIREKTAAGDARRATNMEPVTPAAFGCERHTSPTALDLTGD